MAAAIVASSRAARSSGVSVAGGGRLPVRVCRILRATAEGTLERDSVMCRGCARQGVWQEKWVLLKITSMFSFDVSAGGSGWKTRAAHHRMGREADPFRHLGSRGGRSCGTVVVAPAFRAQCIGQGVPDSMIYDKSAILLALLQNAKEFRSSVAQ
jgi:hypothetical protein